MKIELLIVKIATENYALDLASEITSADEAAPSMVGVFPQPLRLQQGYRTPQQALQALFDCLSFAPPDLAVYDEAVAQVAVLSDGIGNLNDAMTVVGDRLTNCEDAIQQLVVPPVARQNPLLAGRRQPPPQGQPLSQRPQAPPPIRRMSLGHGSHAGDITAGPIRGRGSEFNDEPEPT